VVATASIIVPNNPKLPHHWGSSKLVKWTGLIYSNVNVAEKNGNM
jgi:hypothetical protein